MKNLIVLIGSSKNIIPSPTNKICASYNSSLPIGPGRNWTAYCAPLPVSGRYVTITKTRSDWANKMTLCEVAFFATSEEGGEWWMVDGGWWVVGGVWFVGGLWVGNGLLWVGNGGGVVGG